MLLTVAGALGSGLKYVYTRPLLINALRTNANQAEALCATAPHSYFEAVGAAIKTAAMIRSRDRNVVVKATVPSYDAAGSQIVLHWAQLLGKLKLAGMAVGAALIIGMSTGFPSVIVIILSAGVGIGWLWLFFYKAEVERCILRARAEILPEVDSAFAAGRYVFPPLPPT